MKHITTIAFLLLILVGCSDPEPVDPYPGWNLNGTPTEPGLFDGISCGEDVPMRTDLCLRDGDRSYYVCRQTADGTAVVLQLDCKYPAEFCYAARDSQEAQCLIEEAMLATPEGIEPGSDHWKRKRERVMEEDPDYLDTPARTDCCRICFGPTKPCGDECIATNEECSEPPGCTC